MNEQNKERPRLITNEELADLSNEWLNSTVDIVNYHQTCMAVFEVNEETFKRLKRSGVCCQLISPNKRNGNTVDRYYVGF